MNGPGRPDVWRAAARLHAENIDRGFLSRLGTRFLTQLYRAIDGSDEGVLLVEVCEGQIAGFIAGSRGTRAVYREMIRHPLALAIALLPVLVRPAVWPGIVESMRHASNADRVEGLPEAELLSLAIDPRFRRGGVAERLYRRLQLHFAQSGEACFRILVGDELEPARRFYVKMGARAHSSATPHRGSHATLFIQESLPAQAPAPGDQS